MHADFLAKIANGGDLPMSEKGQWHHMWPLCMSGSVEDLRNYVWATLVSLFGNIQCLIEWLRVLLDTQSNCNCSYQYYRRGRNHTTDCRRG